MHSRASLRRDRADVLEDLVGERLEPGLDQQLEPTDQEVLVPEEVDRRAPALPAVRPAAVQVRAEKADEDRVHV